VEFKARLKGVGIAFIITLVAMPVAVVITFFTFPFWRWFEETNGIESFGHSGPAEWCYLAVYLFTIICAAIIWSQLRHNKEEQF
jgi:uncharacterized membrane protein YphA (DoxX/SURF4 family)